MLRGDDTGRTPAAMTNLILAMLCLLSFLQGVGEVMNPNYMKRLLGGMMVVAGDVGVIANLIAYRRQRKQAKQRESGK